MTLGEKQRRHTYLTGKLIEFAYENGYELTWGNTWRSPEEAKRLAKLGKGIANSLHGDRLAVDFNLFKDGEYLTGTEDHRPLGKFWESLGTEECKTVWGGRFGDGNHYSIKHEGRA